MGGRSGVSRDGITRKRFLGNSCAALAAALAGAAGCGPAGGVRPIFFPHPEGGEWVFRSRPDLRPPAVTVAKRTEGTAPGCVFVAPKNGPGETGPGQRGPMILDGEGRPVWFRPLREEGVDAMDFKAQRFRGRPVITWWQGPHTAYGQGEYAVLDGSYGEVARVGAGGGYLADLHEFLITERNTALVTVYGHESRDLSAAGGAGSALVAEGIVQEVLVESGEVLFER